mgnify:CR=1 FL=1
MRLTKRQLKRIIKEEKAKLIKEGIWDTLSGKGSQSSPPWLSFAVAYASCSPEAQAVVQSLSMGTAAAGSSFEDMDAVVEAYEKLYDSLREIYDNESTEIAGKLEELAYGE